MRLALTGGGTAGHVAPNFAVIAELKKLDPNLQLLYIGSKALEKKLVAQQKIPFKQILAGKLRRYFSIHNFLDLFKIPLGTIQALFHLQKFKPDLLFSKGGYVSVPVVTAAWILRIPIICHESDLTPGLANKISLKFAKKILTSFPQTKKHLPNYLKKIIHTGQPIRPEIFQGKASKAQELLKLNQLPVILIMGGSQGAKQINDLVDNNLDELTKKYQIIHLRGQSNCSKQKNYYPFSYVNDELKHFYQASDLIISRAGANSLAEISALAKKAIIIPLSTKSSRGDQLENAKLYSEKYHYPVLTGKITSNLFLTTIQKTLKTKKHQSKQQNAAEKIAKIIYQYPHIAVN